ncbi:uncharacterized protein [Eurosta solidaginis]|uniref:uncharacterized protein n=1 Tax=Eurosta solidaginis TaxID=178769 RepID=UPI00353131D2
MQAHHAMPDFRCRSTCTHKECQRHAYLGIVDQHEQCQCLGEVNASSIFLENVLDMANTLAQIMIICGIHECKAKSTVDVITYAFLHYDQVCYCIDTRPKKRLRKEDLFHEFGKRCLMNRVEAHLAYTIVKRGFKAFYYQPSEERKANDGRPTFSEECVYVHAARQTAESFARYDGLSCEEQRGFEAKIMVAYKKFYDRMQTRKNQPVGEECNCCFCAKKRGHLIYGKPVPQEEPKKKKEPHRCPYCCQKKKKKFIHAASASAKCPKCHRAMRYCMCPKYDFKLDWVKSIWVRPDMDLYYKQTIEERPIVKSGCEPDEPEPEIKVCDSQEIAKEEVEEEEQGFDTMIPSPDDVELAALNAAVEQDLDVEEEEGE